MATITRYRKRDGSYSYTAQIRIRRGGKIVYSESFTHPKKTVAQSWAKKRESELAEPGALERLRHAGVTVGEVLTWYRDFHEAEMGRTQSSSIRAMIRTDLAEADAIALKSSDVIQHAHERRDTAGPATVLQDIIWLRIAMDQYRLAHDAPVAVAAVEDAMAVLRKARIVGRGEARDRRPTLDELNRLLTFFQDRDQRADIPMVDILLFALFSSRRQAEICRITWEDLDTRGRKVLVRKMKHPRAAADTWCYLTDEALAIIERQPRTGGCIFPYNSKSVGAAFTRACHVLAIEDLRFHDLRHECVSWLFDMGWDIPRVAQVSGHRSWASLQRYTHMQHLRAHDKYEGWSWRPEVRPPSSCGGGA